MLLLCCLFAGAQTPLPLNPDVKHGTLPNGMQYFVLHNEEPKERANFYIAQKVGSTLETPEQLGLAHFLEHMAFNGTTNYPGKNMLNYLQGKGIRFGSDINAYTSFDETVYNINNVPTTDKALMDSVLLVLHDWSGEILLEEDEINAERGVIEEEWRSRNNANSRMLETILPIIYAEYNYQQTPIGKMEIVRNFPPEAIRSYYKKWYRPDQQGIVIVGDFDAAEMEKKVIDMFSNIPMPENAAERTYPTVSDNEKPIFAYFEDSEMRFPRADLSFKTEKIPFEYRNTLEAYMQQEIVEELIAIMLNTRLDEYQKTPECKYAYAGVNFGDYWVSKTKGAFNVVVIGKEGIKDSFADAMALIARALKTGFTDSELARARDNMLANYEKAFNERKSTRNEAYASSIIRHFVDNTPEPGIEAEYEMVKQVLPMIPVQALNEGCKALLTPQNQVLVVSMPKKEGMEVVTETEMIGSLENAINAEYEAFVDEVITEPLIAKLPKPGKITSEKAGKFETTEFTLSNGARVIIKPTDFKADEIMMTAWKEGGKRMYPESDAPNVLLAGDAFELCKMGPFNPVQLSKYLTGKKVSLGYTIGNTVNSLDGYSTVKDLPTLMELIYTAFTAIGPDAASYNAQMEQAKTLFRNNDKNPNMIFNKHKYATSYGNNPMYAQPDVQMIESANYDKMLAMIKESMQNAADYTFIFVGNVDAATLKPLLEQYIASLPGNPKKAVKNVKELSPITMVTGQVKDEFKQPMQVPATMVYDVYGDNNLEYNIENSVKIGLMGDLLSNIFTETLREEEGGTYSPHAWAYMSPYTKTWHLFYQFQTNDKQQETLIARANDEFLKMLAEGVTEVNFNKVKEAALKQYEIGVRTNSYWMQNLMLLERGFDDITNNRSAIENLTQKDMNQFMRTLYNEKNRIQVIMQGVPVEN